LFNIYFTELDKFVEKLKSKIFVCNQYNDQKNVIVELRHLQQKFSNNEKFCSDLEKCGSSELIIASYKKEKKAFYKKYGYSGDADFLSRNLFYVRYVDDFLLGISGSRLFAVKIIHQIKIFFQRRLKLNLKCIKIINRYKANMKFLGFIVYLPQVNKKATIKNNKLKIVKKYIARSKARVATGLIKNSKAFFYGLRHDIVSSLKQYSKKFNKNTSQLENLIDNKFRLQSENLKYNKRKKFEIANHFKNLFSKNFTLALQSFSDNFKPFIDNKEFQYTDMAVELNDVTENFLKTLKKIEVNVKNNWLANRRKSVVEKYKNKFVSKNLVWTGISRKDSKNIIGLLSRQVFSVKKISKIFLIFPLKDFYNKLRVLGYIHAKKNRSIGKISLINVTDYEIIKYFNKLICGYLNWFRCVDNIYDIKKIWYILIKSCLYTLARKHKKDYS